MSPRSKNIFSTLLNLFIVIDMFFSVRGFFTAGVFGNMTGKGWDAFKYYTILSNVFCAVCCLAVLIFNIRGLKKGRLEMPRWVLILKFAGTVAVTVTFTVVIVFLGPLFGYRNMYQDANLFMHLLNALAALAGFLLFENGMQFPKKHLLWGDLSVFLYGNVYLVMVLILKKWPDFYGFATVLKWWISYPGMMILGYLISLGIWKLYRQK